MKSEDSKEHSAKKYEDFIEQLILTNEKATNVSFVAFLESKTED